MYKILLLTPKAAYDITDRAGLNFTLKFNESHKGEGNFSIRTSKGEVIPSYDQIIEVYDDDELIWFGNIIKATKPSAKEGNVWKVVTNNPESVLANRIPLMKLENVTVTEILNYLYDYYIKYEIGWSEDTPTSRHADIDSLDFMYFRFSNEENDIYKILDDLANAHQCWWAVHMYSGRPYFVFKKNGTSIGGIYLTESDGFLSDIKISAKSDWCNRLTVEDGWVKSEDLEPDEYQTQFMPERFADDYYVTELKPGKLLPDEGIWGVYNFETEWTHKIHGQRNPSTRESQEVIRSIDPEYDDPDIGNSTLVYHTIGDKTIRLNTLFNYEEGGVLPKYAYRSFIPKNDEVEEGTFCIITVKYWKCRKYIKNYNESLPIGKYSGIIDKREKLEGVRFGTRDQGDEYSGSLKDWYSKPQETVTVKSDKALDRVFLRTLCTLEFPSYGIKGDYLCTDISIESKIPDTEGCASGQRYGERTYTFSSKEPDSPAKLLRSDDRYYNKDIKPRPATASTETFNLGDGYHVSKRIGMYVTSVNGTEGNNGQMATPLDLPLN